MNRSRRRTRGLHVRRRRRETPAPEGGPPPRKAAPQVDPASLPNADPTPEQYRWSWHAREEGLERLGATGHRRPEIRWKKGLTTEAGAWAITVAERRGGAVRCTVFLDASLDGEHLVETLAHELHHCRSFADDYDGTRSRSTEELEAEANRFAARLKSELLD